MASVPDLPVISGLEALKLYATFFGDPAGIGRTYHQRLGPKVIVKQPLSSRAQGRKYLAIAKETLAESVLNDPKTFRSVGLSIARGPKGSAQRRLRNGIVRMNGPQQRALRRAYAPPLAKNQLCQQQGALDEICAEEISTWPRGSNFDATSSAMRITRRAAADLLFGAEDDTRAMEIAEILDHHSRLQYSLKASAFPVNVPGTPYHELLEHAEITENALIAWIKDQDDESHNLVGCIAHMEEADGADVDLQARAAQLWTLFGASFETTATTLRWTLLHLAWNPEAQARLSAEIAEHGADTPFLEAIILESLRITPPVAYQLRRVSEATEFEGCALNKGDHVVISAIAINRDPEVYANPDHYIPERWLDMDASPTRPLAFSAGPRRCLGFNFAMMVLRASLAELYRTSIIDIPDAEKIDVRLAITQAPKRLPIILKPKTEAARASRFGGTANRQMSAPG